MEFGQWGSLSYSIEQEYLIEFNDGLKSAKYKLDSKLEKDIENIRNDFLNYRGSETRIIQSIQFLLDNQYNLLREHISMRSAQLDKLKEKVIFSEQYCDENRHINTIEKIKDRAERYLDEITDDEAEIIYNSTKYIFLK